LIFLNCSFLQALVAKGYPYDVSASSTSFMRPWGQDGNTAIINCAVGSQISSAGWTVFGSGTETTCRARETGTTLIASGSVNVPQVRWNAGAYWVNTYDPDYTSSSMSPTDPLLAVPTGTNNRVLVTVDTNSYTLSAIFGNAYYGLGGWLPTVMPTITSQPTNETINAGATATFAVTEAGDAATYSVIVSNSAGAVASSNAVLSVVTPVNTTPTNMMAVLVGNTIQLSWPTDHLGWRLQYQTNSSSQGLGTNWADWPGASNVFLTNIIIDPSVGSAFFRLVYP
jgi:hypothetical protein